MFGGFRLQSPTLVLSGFFFFLYSSAELIGSRADFDWAVKLTRGNGCIYVDNVVRALIWDGQVGASENVVTKVGNDERVSATLVPTIGSHKLTEEMFDDFIFAVVKDGRKLRRRHRHELQ